MAKETRLDESAEIYKPRDNRTEKQKLKDMTFQEKLVHINAYYKYKIIAVLAIVGVLSTLFYTIFSPKDETVFNAAIINQSLDTAKKNDFITDFGKYLNLKKDQNIVLDDSYYMDDVSGSSASIQKLQTYVYVNQIDVIIADESVFKDYAKYGYFDNLTELLPTDLYSKFTNNLYMGSTDDDKEEKAYGIYLTDNNMLRDLGIVSEKPVLGIVANSKYKENSYSFLRYIFHLD